MADDEDLKLALDGVKDLASFDLSGADLSGVDFRGCDFTDTDLAKANLSGANISDCDFSSAVITHLNLSGAIGTMAKFQGSVYGINFSKSDLTKSSWNRCLFSDCIFDEAVLRGADFKNCRTGKNSPRNSYKSAIIDEFTDFENFQVLRADSKDETFRYFDFKRGKLTRKTDLKIAAKSVETPVQKLAQAILNDPESYAGSLEQFLEIFDEQISWFESKKPNQNSEEWEQHYQFLTQTRNELVNIKDDVNLIVEEPTKERAIEVATKSFELSKGVQNWCKDFLYAIAKSGKPTATVTIVGGLSWFLSSFFGMDPNLSAGVAIAAAAPDLVKHVKEIVS